MHYMYSIQCNIIDTIYGNIHTGTNMTNLDIIGLAIYLPCTAREKPVVLEIPSHVQQRTKDTKYDAYVRTHVHTLTSMSPSSYTSWSAIFRSVPVNFAVHVGPRCTGRYVRVCAVLQVAGRAVAIVS